MLSLSPSLSTLRYTKLSPTLRQGLLSGKGLEDVLLPVTWTGRDGPVWETDGTMEGTHRTIRKEPVSAETAAKQVQLHFAEKYQMPQCQRERGGRGSVVGPIGSRAVLSISPQVPCCPHGAAQLKDVNLSR